MATRIAGPLKAFGALAQEYETISVEQVSSVIHDRCVIHEAASLPEIGGDWHGPQGFVDLMAAVQKAFNGFKFSLVKLVADDDTLIIRGKLSFDLPAGSFTIPIVEYWAFEDGKAVDILPVWHDTKLVADMYAKSYPNGKP